MKTNALSFLAAIIAAAFQLNGCATVTAGAECAAESVNPTLMASIDSFESAGLSIQLSNRVLLEAPLSEQDEWPSKLFGTPSGGDMFRIGLSLLSSTQGVTVPLKIDPETGLPRPTSALYLFLQERSQILDKEFKKEDVNFFRSKPKTVISCPLGHRKKEGTIDDNMYRNPLMAYGVVTGNQQQLAEFQQEIELTSKGFKRCNAFIHKTTEELTDQTIKKAACPDPALKDEAVKATLTSKVAEMQEELAQMQKAHGQLAEKVYKASVAGADYSAAALLKLGCAIINGTRAVKNVNKEFSGLKGAYNIAMILPRIKNAIKSFGIYRDNLGLQFTVYKTMYQQIKGSYQIEDDEQTNQSLPRIEGAEHALADIEPKLLLAAAGQDIEFTDAELMKLNLAAAMFPHTTNQAADVYLAQVGSVNEEANW